MKSSIDPIYNIELIINGLRVPSVFLRSMSLEYSPLALTKQGTMQFEIPLEWEMNLGTEKQLFDVVLIDEKGFEKQLGTRHIDDIRDVVYESEVEFADTPYDQIPTSLPETIVYEFNTIDSENHRMLFSPKGK